MGALRCHILKPRAASIHLPGDHNIAKRTYDNFTQFENLDSETKTSGGCSSSLQHEKTHRAIQIDSHIKPSHMHHNQLSPLQQRPLTLLNKQFSYHLETRDERHEHPETERHKPGNT